MVIEPIFEREFAEHSYGFRPGRSCHDALRRVEALLRKGHAHVVDIDIKGYFDAIPHEQLMKKVAERIADGRVLELINRFLKAGIMEGMEHWEANEGAPQGAVMSPLLANVYLNPLDWLLAAAGFEMVRYADDMVVLCPDAQSAHQAMELIRQWMREAGLELNEQKSRIVDLTERGSHFDFLGYRFWRGKDGKIQRYVRPKSEKKLRERLRPLTKRASGWSLQAILAKINPILRGWYGYFKHASALSMRQVDGWVRGRLRSIHRKRNKCKGRARGCDHQRWGNSYFEQHGYFSLEATRAFELACLR
jgi:RNA-directed DNA polymerase